MSQDWTNDSFAAGHVAQTDLQNMENNFLALQSSFSGASNPAGAVAGTQYMDTGSKTLKVYNSVGSAWLAQLLGDATQLMWVYRNDTCDGWVVDTSVTDAGLAIKGGAQAYNVNGGNVAGTWTQPDGTISIAQMAAHSHTGATAAGSAHNHGFSNGQPYYGTGGSKSDGGTYLKGGIYSNYTAVAIANESAHTHTIASAGSGAVHSHGTAYRFRAAVGTMQKPDLT